MKLRITIWYLLSTCNISMMSYNTKSFIFLICFILGLFLGYTILQTPWMIVSFANWVFRMIFCKKGKVESDDPKDSTTIDMTCMESHKALIDKLNVLKNEVKTDEKKLKERVLIVEKFVNISRQKRFS